jgi:hypothetical protein
VLGHALGAGRGREKAVDEAFEGVGPYVFSEGADFGGRRWETGKVEGDAAKEDRAIGLWRRIQVEFGKSEGDEVIDGVSRPRVAG